MNLWIEKCCKCGTQNAYDLGDPQDYTARDISHMWCRQCKELISNEENIDAYDRYIVMGKPLSHYMSS